MFLPKAAGDQVEDAQAEADRRAGCARVEGWATELIPEGIREGVMISVQEVQCGDPECAPIDTAVTILFPSGGRGMMGLPMEAKDVKKEHLSEFFPTEEVLTKWSKGEEADWPPMDDIEYDEDTMRPKLRFVLGQRVQCRIGPDPVTGWAPGRISQLWYREANWPPGSWAPYQIHLDDGRMIFAPGDMDQVIRAEPISDVGGENGSKSEGGGMTIVD